MAQRSKLPSMWSEMSSGRKGKCCCRNSKQNGPENKYFLRFLYGDCLPERDAFCFACPCNFWEGFNPPPLKNIFCHSEGRKFICLPQGGRHTQGACYVLQSPTHECFAARPPPARPLRPASCLLRRLRFAPNKRPRSPPASAKRAVSPRRPRPNLQTPQPWRGIGPPLTCHYQRVFSTLSNGGGVAVFFIMIWLTGFLALNPTSPHGQICPLSAEGDGKFWSANQEMVKIHWFVFILAQVAIVTDPPWAKSD